MPTTFATTTLVLLVTTNRIGQTGGGRQERLTVALHKRHGG